MAAKVLIATPIRSFGELVLQALQEVGYFPLLVADVSNALIAAREDDPALAILDCKMPDPGSAFMVTALREQIHDLPLLLIYPDGSCPENIAIDPLIDVILPQPFYLPDLLTTVERMLPQVPAPPSIVPPQNTEIPLELAWLKDVNRSAQYLTRLSLEADAQAALIIRYARIWAYAGQLPHSAAEELALLIGQHWANGESGDLARFVRLNTIGGEFMLYATALGAGFVLALIYEAEMPFSKMRAQTGELARKLTSPLLDFSAEIEKAPAPRKQPSPPEIDEYSADDWVPEADASQDDDQDWPPEDDLLAQQAAMFEALLASIDIPDPDGARDAERVQLETALDRQVEIKPQKTAGLPEVREAVAQPMIVETALVNASVSRTEIRLEPESPALHDLAYACVLVTRLPSQMIAGDLGVLLNRVVTRLCLAYGWRLEHLAIRPQYLHWVVSVSPQVPPAEVIRNLREQTSALIFEEMPKLAKENPSGDFWAPGYMVVHGRQTLSGDLLRDFIRQTRLHQGLETP